LVGKDNIESWTMIYLINVKMNIFTVRLLVIKKPTPLKNILILFMIFAIL